MKAKSTQQEILLMTNTTFAARQWCEKDAEKNTLTPQEQMEEVCANGLMRELLPEVFETPENKKLYLWQMRPGFSFLQLELGEFPLAIDDEHSIDPHNFLHTMWCN